MGVNVPEVRSPYLQEWSRQWVRNRLELRSPGSFYERDLTPQKLTIRRPFIFALPL